MNLLGIICGYAFYRYKTTPHTAQRKREGGRERWREKTEVGIRIKFLCDKHHRNFARQAKPSRFYLCINIHSGG